MIIASDGRLLITKSFLVEINIRVYEIYHSYYII